MTLPVWLVVIWALVTVVVLLPLAALGIFLVRGLPTFGK